MRRAPGFIASCGGKMKPERWRQIEQLYQSALERDAARRKAFLDEACAGDEELRREVESMLAAHEQAKGAEDFLNQPALEVAAKPSPTIRRSLWWGGSWAATRFSRSWAGAEWEKFTSPRIHDSDASWRSKLLPQEFTLDRERVQRFKQEARAASALNHPNIITIFEIDQIQTEAGDIHFIAAEFIDGQTLRQRLAGGAVDIERGAGCRRSSRERPGRSARRRDRASRHQA